MDIIQCIPIDIQLLLDTSSMTVSVEDGVMQFCNVTIIHAIFNIIHFSSLHLSCSHHQLAFVSLKLPNTISLHRLLSFATPHVIGDCTCTLLLNCFKSLCICLMHVLFCPPLNLRSLLITMSRSFHGYFIWHANEVSKEHQSSSLDFLAPWLKAESML